MSLSETVKQLKKYIGLQSSIMFFGPVLSIFPDQRATGQVRSGIRVVRGLLRRSSTMTAVDSPSP